MEVKSDLSPVFLNTLLLGQRQAHSFTCHRVIALYFLATRQSCVVLTETIGSIKPKVFTLLCGEEKVPQSCFSLYLLLMRVSNLYSDEISLPS